MMEYKGVPWIPAAVHFPFPVKLNCRASSLENNLAKILLVIEEGDLPPMMASSFIFINTKLIEGITKICLLLITYNVYQQSSIAIILAPSNELFKRIKIVDWEVGASNQLINVAIVYFP